MKKTKLTRSLLAACSIVALTAVMYGCVHDGGDEPATEPPVVTPDPEPEPDPGAMDLSDTQAAAAAAATAAMTASSNAAASAKSAADATANLATLQTGQAAGGHAKAAAGAAATAMAEYMKAKAASEAAAAATLASAAGGELAKATAAQAAAEAAAKMAADYAKKATDAAKMELMIDGTMKSVGDSSIDANMGSLTTYDDDHKVKAITGETGSQPMRATAMRPGQAFAQRSSTATPPTTKDTPYKQAVAAGTIRIGKALDTTDDMARLTIITSYEGDKTVRVFVDGAVDAVANVVAAATAATEDAAEIGGALEDGATAKPVGAYYKAEHYSDATTAAPTDTALGAFDRVTVDGAKGEPIFLLSSEDGTATAYARRVDSTTNVATGKTTHTYRVVDVMADASATDGPDEDGNPEDLAVKVSIPAAVKYSHIHFGVWSSLKDNEDGDNSVVTGLGIGFVQNFSDSGVTAKQGIGSATFNGDWVAAVRKMHSTSYTVEDGAATLTADFGEGEFTGDLTGLAMLEGKMTGNGFSGTKATVGADNTFDLDSDGTFAGSFSGNIYGPAGDEAAGVFSFSGGEAGAFRGAFGGTSKE